MDGDQISGVIPGDLLCTVDPFQGCCDRVGSPHSRRARLGFHHAINLKRDHGMLAGLENIGTLSVLAAGADRDRQQ